MISRHWAMPNKNTFSIKPINELIYKWLVHGKWLDPFSRNSPYATRCITNDLSEEFKADHHMESIDFLRQFDTQSVDGVLFDPPYSPRQISECYKQVGREVHMQDTQSSFYGDRKNEIQRITKKGALVLCFGWNSQGMGINRGFKMLEIMLVAHGGAHNDTICTVEQKVDQ